MAYLAVALKNNTINVFSAETSALLATLEGHQYRIYDMCFFPDGSQLVTCSQDGSIRVWDLSTFAEVRRQTFENMRRICIDSTGTKLAVNGPNFIRIIDFGTMAELLKIDYLTDCYSGVSFGINNETIVVSAHYGIDSSVGCVVAYDAEVGTAKNRFIGTEGAVWQLAMNPANRTLVCVLDKKSIKIVDITREILLANILTGSEYISCVSFSHDGTRMAGCSGYGGIRLFDTYTWETVARIGKDKESTYKGALLNQSGNLLFGYRGSGEVYMHDTGTGTILSTLRSQAGVLFCALLNGDGMVLF
jgi:WD40 repeat protein